MANHLNVAQVHSILTLYERGWSCRRIARELGVHRETVSRHVRQARAPAGPGSKPAKAPTGSEVGESTGSGSKPATAPTGSESPLDLPEPAMTFGPIAPLPARPVRGECPPEGLGPPAAAPRSLPRSASAARPFHAVILAKLEQGHSAVRIHQDLVGEHAEAAPSYYSVKRYVRRLGVAASGGGGGGGAAPMRRMECLAGAEAQVDFGRGAVLVDRDPQTGHVRRRHTHVLRVVLSHSRKAYSEAVERQTTESFIRALENAFHHFGGAPGTLVLDNLRAAVKRADWFDPELNPKVQSFCAHYGIVALPTKPYMPRHKGKVERGIAYVQSNALRSRQFTDLAQQNAHLLEWETTVADTRIHGTTRRQVRELFEQVERSALRPLPANRFPCFSEGQRVVHRDGHVEVAKAYYSVPPEYLGRTVWVRWDSRLIRIFDARMQLVATHARKDPGQFSTQDRHLLDRKINSVERGAVWLLSKVSGIGTQAQRWGEAMVQARGIEGLRVLQGLLSMSHKHPHDQLDRACGIALEHGAWRLRTIRQLVQRNSEHVQRQEPFAFIDEHPIIRPLSDYDQLVHEAFLQPQPSGGWRHDDE
jgi:transposase